MGRKTLEKQTETEESLVINKYTNPNKKRLIRSVYYLIAVLFLFIPAIDFSDKLKSFSFDVYKNFGDFAETAGNNLLKILSITLIVSVIWFAFNLAVFCVFSRLYLTNKPFYDKDSEKLATLLSKTFVFSKTKGLFERIKDYFTIKIFVAIKTGFCKEFSEELINSALYNMFSNDNFNLFAIAKTFSLFSPLISRENKIVFSEYLIQNYKDLWNIENPENGKNYIEIIYELQQKTESPFILEPARSSVENILDVDVPYEPYKKQNSLRKFDFKTKIISFVLLCLMLCFTEVYIIVLCYSYPLLKELFLDNFLLISTMIILSAPIVLIDGIFLWITCANHKPERPIDKTLLLPFTKQEVVVPSKPKVKGETEPYIETELNIETEPYIETELNIETEPNTETAPKQRKEFINKAALSRNLKVVLAACLTAAATAGKSLKALSINLYRIIKAKISVLLANYKKLKADNNKRRTEAEIQKAKAQKAKLQREAEAQKAKLQREAEEFKARAEKKRLQKEAKLQNEADKLAKEKANALRKAKLEEKREAEKIRLQNEKIAAAAQKSKAKFEERNNREKENAVNRRELAKQKKELERIERQKALARQIEINKRIARQQLQMQERILAERKAARERANKKS